MRNRRPLTLLVTGFGPFPGVRANPTEGMARRAAASRRWRRLGLDVVAHVFPTRWTSAALECPAVLCRVKPDAVLHLGVAARRRRLSVETVARPSPSALAPDAAGARAPPAAAGGGPLAIAAPAAAMLAAIRRAGAACALSNDAGRYLCNALYHRSLSLRREAAERRPTLFLHLPMPGPARSAIPAARLRSRKPSEAAMRRAIEAALLLLARQARRRP